MNRKALKKPPNWPGSTSSYYAFVNQRRVWAVLSVQPDISIRRLATLVHVTPDTAWRHVSALRDAGYIAYVDDAVRARRIVLPLYFGRGDVWYTP